MSEPSLFIATPIHSNWLHQAYVGGLLSAHAAFADRIRIETRIGTSLSRQRDLLTTQFLQSGASHCLWVDSDIGWSAAHAQKLIDADKPFIAGTYCKKTDECPIPSKLTGSFASPEIFGAEFVPAGFLLLRRDAAEQMIGAYSERQYQSDGLVTCGLWTTDLGDATEDVSFCRRYRALGGECWLHLGVQLMHFGEKGYFPTTQSIQMLAGM